MQKSMEKIFESGKAFGFERGILMYQEELLINVAMKIKDYPKLKWYNNLRDPCISPQDNVLFPLVE